MKHRIKAKHFNRDTKSRKALFKNLLRDLFTHGHITTSESRVKEIEGIFGVAEIIEIKNNKEIVSIGSKVIVLVNDIEKEYTIVGAQEADPLSRKISNESPLGKAFLGHEVGDVVDVEIPGKKVRYKIVNIK